MIEYIVEETPLGLMLGAVSGKGVCAVFFGDDSDSLVAELRRRFPGEAVEQVTAESSGAFQQLRKYFTAPQSAVGLALDIRGTSFQRQVWQALQEIPCGTTLSYRQVAEKIGKPRAVRAVAGACAANSIAVLIPCHRVVRSDETLSGYRWGVERKRRLLAIEQVERGAYFS